jgi:hypothetical protein
MAALFSRGVNDIHFGDIDELVREKQPETDTLEFKQSLPCKKGRDDWYSGAAAISDYARNQLLEEIIAFANSHGGHLILGIKESDDHPHRAVGFEKVPRCVDLAEKLKLQIRDCIEPLVPVIDVRGIVADENGEGVVVVRVPQSRAAPHRLRANKECYFRHADRTETMTMREIQDLTIQRSQTAEKLESLFSDRRKKFHEWMSSSSTRNAVTVGCRATLIPTGAIYADSLFRNRVFVPHLQKFKFELTGGNKIDAFIPSSATEERPIVRGTCRMDVIQEPSVIQEVHCAGLIEVRFRDHQERAQLFVDWILGVLCNGLLMADTFRKAAGAPDMEYAFELEISASSATIPVRGTGRFGYHSALGISPNAPCLYPRMSLGDYDSELNRLVEIAITDIWNSCGVSFAEKITMVSRLS